MMDALLQDLRYAVRAMLKSPGFTAVALLSLVVGVGANAAVFSLVNTILFHPLPVAEPQRLVEVTPSKPGLDFGLFSYPAYKDLRDRNEVFEGMAAYRFAPMSLSREGNNERIWGFEASGNYFDLLGVQPAAGRFFTQEEDRVPGAVPVAVLSYGCWQRRFGGDPKIVGQEITINSHRFTVTGIAPEGFGGTVLIFTPEVWVPMMMSGEIEPGSNWLDNANNGVLFTIGRLKPRVNETQATQSLNGLIESLVRVYPNYEGLGVTLSPPGLVLPALRQGTLGFSFVLMAAVALVLLIACVNLANMLLARAAGRRKEIAIRLALGASRGRLIRQLLSESLLLALVGGAAGGLLAYWMAALASKFTPPVDFSLKIDLKSDWRVLVFALIVSLISGVIFGLVPALQSTKSDLVGALKDETGAAPRRSRLRSALVVAQVAFSLVLLVAAGLIVRSLQQVQLIGPGFQTEHAITMSMDLGLQGYTEPRGREFYKELISRVETLPGVRSATLANYLPLALNRNSTSLYIEGQPVPRPSDVPEVQDSDIWPGYLETMAIPLVEGREFQPGDENKETRRVIVNETFAKRFWPGQSAIGKRVSTAKPDGPWWEIVGVAKNGKYWSLGEDPQPFLYFPMQRDYDPSAALVVSSTADPRPLINAIRAQVQQMDPNLPVYDIKTMEQHMRLTLLPLQAGAWVAGTFAFLALALAGLGLYGVMAYSVSQRTREIGLRMALGASSPNLLGLIVKEGARLALIGLGIGLAGALLLTRLMSSVLYGVSATDVETFVAVPLLLAAVVLLACYVPARRAVKVDPMIALRYE
jgi:predicted permease